MKKLALFLFFVLLCVASPFDAQATDRMFMKTVDTSDLPLKAFASKSAPTMDTLQKGEVVHYTIHETVKNGWLYVHHDGQKGYVNAGLLSENMIGSSIAPYEPNFSMYRLTENVNVLRKNKPTTLLKDSFVYKANMYYKTTITYADDIATKYMTRIPPTMRASKTDIVVKQNPSPSAKTLFTLPANTAVESYGTLPGSWRIIRYGDVIGFVSAKPLEAVKASKQYVKLHGLPLRNIPSNSASARISNFLQQGIVVTVYASTNGWSYVTVGELGGYVPASMLSAKTVAYTKTRKDGLPVDMTILQRFIVKTTTKTNNDGQKYYEHTLRIFDAFTNSYVDKPVAYQYVGESIGYIQKTMDTYVNEVQAAITMNKKYGTTYAACGSDFVLCYEQNGKYVSFVEQFGENKSFRYLFDLAFTFGANNQLHISYRYFNDDEDFSRSNTLSFIFNDKIKRYNNK